MADFTALKTAIQNAIKQNGNEEITGNLLQDVLLAIVTTLGEGNINNLINSLDAEVTARQQAVSAEAQARQLADSTLQGGINTVSAAITAINNAIGNGCVYAGIATPSSTPASGKVFYLALTAGTYTNYGGLEVSQGINILKNNGSTWSLDSFLGIDDAPTPSSNNLVKSSGVFNGIMTNGSAFDLSAYNNGTTYADLNAALIALNTLPAAYKRGGMSLKFVLTSDNKYVQYRLKTTDWSITEADWEKESNEELEKQINGTVSVSGMVYADNTQSQFPCSINVTNGKIRIGLQASGILSTSNEVQIYYNSVSTATLLGTIASGQTKYFVLADTEITKIILFISPGAFISRGKAVLNIKVYNGLVDTKVDVNCGVKYIFKFVQTGLTESWKCTVNPSHKYAIRFSKDTTISTSSLKFWVGAYDNTGSLISTLCTYYGTQSLTSQDFIITTPATCSYIQINVKGTSGEETCCSIIDNTAIKPLSGKNVLFIGDSITWYGYYINKFVELTGCIDYNRGANGTTVAVYDRFTTAMSARVDFTPNNGRGDQWREFGYPSVDIDYIFILGGINDWGVARRVYDGVQPEWTFDFGDIHAEATKETYCGAWKYLLKRLRERYPTAKIYTMLVYNVVQEDESITSLHHSEIGYTTNVKDISAPYTEKEVVFNNNTYTLDSLRNVVKEVSRLYGIDCIDLRKAGFSSFVEAERNEYFVTDVSYQEEKGDGLHVNQAGGNFIGEYMYKYIFG